MGAASAAASYVGGEIGQSFGQALGGSSKALGAFYGDVFGGAFAGAAGGATGAAFTGGDVAKAAYQGAAVGAASGAVSGAFKAYGIAKQAQAKRIDNLKLALATSETDTVTATTRLPQPAESRVAGMLQKDLKGSNFFDTRNVDLNISYGLGPGATGGLKGDSSGIYSYSGLSLAGGGGLSLTLNTGAISLGRTINLSVSTIYGFGARYTCSYDMVSSTFTGSWSLGVGLDFGVSLSAEKTTRIMSFED